MYTKDFYDIIDAELEKVVVSNSEFELIKRHKKIDDKKANAFLIWFLNFYAPAKGFIYQRYITDGNGDSSCDIIFDLLDGQGIKTFYVVQSKWKSKNNCETELSSVDIKSSLNDFETLLRYGKKDVKNENFKKKYAELIEHYEKNGKIKFIFLTLSSFNNEAEPNIRSFEQQYDGQVRVEILDIVRLKRDYIEKTYKQILTNNPLETLYNLEEEKINLAIERYEGVSGDYMKINNLRRAYIFFLKPKTLFDLFESYRHSLFFKNIRNPLPNSEINEKIVNTLNNEPASFWFYNNGITSISSIMPEHIGKGAKEIELTGLQIINGAQTVHSIWTAYKEASSVKREVMNRESLISMRIFESNDKDFNLKVTRFTNSQNEILASDFYANDDIQIRLQNAFFNTRYWYLKRRGEFKEVPSNVKIISNEFCAAAYLSYHFQNPIDAISKREWLFISHKEDIEGIYEVVFNDRTRFDDMYIACTLFYKFMVILKKDKNWKGVDVFETPLFFYLALMKTVLPKYISLKYTSKVDTNKFIIRAFEDIDKKKMDEFEAVFNFIKNEVIDKFIFDTDARKIEDNILEIFESTTQFEKVKEHFDEINFSVDDVDKYLKK